MSASSPIIVPKPVVTTPGKFDLRDYQIEGVEFLRKMKRAGIGDAPGMGKTAQATYAAEEPVLVICPNYLVPQWVAWLQSQGKDVKAATGSISERMKVLEDGAAWLVCNVEMLSTYAEWFEATANRKRFRTIIFDESHHLKSHKGKRAKTAVKLAKDCEYVFILSATFIKREVDDLFMQFRILHPDIFTSYWKFVGLYCVVDEGYFGTQILGPKKSQLPHLQELMNTLVLVRNYEDVGRSLPPTIERVTPIVLQPAARALYDDVVKHWRLLDEQGELEYFTNYMSIMHLLRQHLTGAIKADAVAELIADEDQKTAIFSWYKNTAWEIGAKLGDKCNIVTGDVNAALRREIAVESGKHVSATISSLGEGVNGLEVETRRAIFAEEDWTPGTNYQVLSRVVRERAEHNEEPVLIDYLVCEKTIDEVIHRTSKDRAATAKQVVKAALYL